MDYPKCIVSDQKEECISIQRANLALYSHVAVCPADSPHEINTRLNFYYDGVLKMLTALDVRCIYSSALQTRFYNGSKHYCLQ